MQIENIENSQCYLKTIILILKLNKLLKYITDSAEFRNKLWSSDYIYIACFRL